MVDKNDAPDGFYAVMSIAGCKGCWFRENNKDTDCYIRNCLQSERDDGLSVRFVKKEITPKKEHELIKEEKTEIEKKNNTALDIQFGGNHYKQFKIQPIEYIQANGLDFSQGNIIKYITRFRFKNGKEDLEKAKHMIDLLIQLEYGEEK